MPSICEKHSNPPDVITSQDEIITALCPITGGCAGNCNDITKVVFVLSGNSKWAHRDDNCLLHRKSQKHFIVICFGGKRWVCGVYFWSLIYSVSHDSRFFDLWRKINVTQSPFWARFVVHTGVEGEEEKQVCIYRTAVRTMNLELKVKVIWAINDMEIIHLHV